MQHYLTALMVCAASLDQRNFSKVIYFQPFNRIPGGELIFLSRKWSEAQRQRQVLCDESGAIA